VLTWLDGQPAECLPLPDRGLSFGDGLFETLLLVDGRPQLATYHRERLARGLGVLAFPDLSEAFESALALAAASAPPGPAALRLTITRGSGPRGYAPPVEVQPRLIAQLSPLDAAVLHWQAPARLGLARMTWSRQPQLAGIKHLNRLEQVLAAAEYTRRGWDEAIMLDPEGGAVSVVAGNLFALREGVLWTPPLTQCGVLGTRRRAVIESWAPALGLRVREGELPPEQLLAAEELFYCNALVGVRAVGTLEGRRWQAHPVTRELHHRYRQSLLAQAQP
jgi:4-amino-4-deoxychorismate lyase